MHAAQEFHGCRIQMFFARHLRLWHPALKATIPGNRRVRERHRRQGEAGDPATAISCHGKHYKMVTAIRIAHFGESSKPGLDWSRPFSQTQILADRLARV